MQHNAMILVWPKNFMMIVEHATTGSAETAETVAVIPNSHFGEPMSAIKTNRKLQEKEIKIYVLDFNTKWFLTFLEIPRRHCAEEWVNSFVKSFFFSKTYPVKNIIIMNMVTFGFLTIFFMFLKMLSSGIFNSNFIKQAVAAATAIMTANIMNGGE